MNPSIEYTEWGLATAILSSDGSSKILLNKNLKKYPELHEHYLKHELSHITSKEYGKSRVNIQDLYLELSGFLTPMTVLKSIFFMIRNPKTLTEFSPIRFRTGGVGVAPILLLLYGLLLLRFLLVL